MAKTKAEPQYFSISQINAFRGCKQRWAYSYRDRLQTRAPQKPLYMGSTLHKLLEIRANGGDWKDHLETVVAKEFNAMPDDYQAILGYDFIDTCYRILDQYEWAYENEPIKYLATEVRIDRKIKGRKRFIGVVDAICEMDGKQYIMEHKSFKSSKMSVDQTWLNPQTYLYAKVLNEQGYRIEGVIWDMIKTSAPQPPKVLKNGAFGKQYSDQTLKSFEWAGVTEIPEDIYEQVKDNHKNFVDRYTTPILPTVMDQIWTEFEQTVNEITRCKTCPKSLGRDCDWCGFKDLCQTELTGGDVAYIKQLYYTTPDQRDRKPFEEFFRSCETCTQCQMIAITSGYAVDIETCFANRNTCEAYSKWKEENKK